MNTIKGFSKLTRQQKIDWVKTACHLEDGFEETLSEYRHATKQNLFDDFSENTLSNFFLPFGVAPNFLINGRLYMVPMVVEESSVVAAAARAAAFWAQNGGFRATVHQTEKTGQIWFQWTGDASLLQIQQDTLFNHLKDAVAGTTKNMVQRGGGITDMEVIPLHQLPSTWQLQVRFETADSMGANFINTCLEEMKQPLMDFFQRQSWPEPDILMAILSNHTPHCRVTCEVTCAVEELQPYAGNLDAATFAKRVKLAVDIAGHNTHRAVTHNKGIFNGVDAVVLATGNDFRAVEAACHAYAARDGQYRSLSQCHISEEGVFHFSTTLPLALGTVGGLTRLHPMAAVAMDILQNPSATDLMGIAASAGLASNFAAVSSLVTIGIQKGHMKLHLSNLLNALQATDDEKAPAMAYFSDKMVTHAAVQEYFKNLRTNKF